ncbi:MAG TPA: hypothetical protein VGD68_04425, partial [Streptosporangiaceae bacterium]
STYRPQGLTIVLVRPDATTIVQRNLVAGRFHLEVQLKELGAPARGASPTPGSAVSAGPEPT